MSIDVSVYIFISIHQEKGKIKNTQLLEREWSG